MAKPWGDATTPQIQDVFLPQEKVIKHKKGLKILCYGMEDTMKSGFCLSCPPPVYAIDTELGMPPLFQHFVFCPTCQTNTRHVPNPDGSYGPCEVCKDPNGQPKDIQWCDATFLDPSRDIQVPEDALTRFEGILMLLKDIKVGTIAIDSATDVWDWIQGWIQQVGKKAKGQLLQFEWPKAYARWNQLVLRLFAKPITVVFTAQPQEIYEDKQATGRYRPRVMKATPHRFDIVIHMARWESVHPTTQLRTVKYKSTIRKCRFKKGYRPQFDELTYQKLVDRLKEDLGVEVW